MVWLSVEEKEVVLSICGLANTSILFVCLLLAKFQVSWLSSVASRNKRAVLFCWCSLGMKPAKSNLWPTSTRMYSSKILCQCRFRDFWKFWKTFWVGPANENRRYCDIFNTKSRQAGIGTTSYLSIRTYISYNAAPPNAIYSITIPPLHPLGSKCHSWSRRKTRSGSHFLASRIRWVLPSKPWNAQSRPHGFQFQIRNVCQRSNIPRGNYA